MNTLADSSPESVPDELDNLSVLLVQTRFPENIGSAARALKNMGLSRLILVDPQTEINDESVRLAGRAVDVLEKTKIFPTFDEAAKPFNLLVASTSARERKLQREIMTPRKAAPLIRQRLSQERVGLVMGSERSGLTDDLLGHCQFLVSIPAALSHPVLNLAQALLICCYEIFQAGGARQQQTQSAVSQGEREELYQQVQQVLTRIGFLSSSNPAPIMKAVRSFWGGPAMSTRDLRILRGIMSQMDWYVSEGYKRGPAAVKKP